MRLRLLLVCLSVLLMAASASGDIAVTIDSVTTGPDYFEDGVRLPYGQLITIWLGWVNTSGGDVSGITNGFKIYSPDGATWDTTLCSNTVGPINWAGSDYFDLVWSKASRSTDGMGSDTVGFGGAAGMNGVGMPNNTIATAWSITIGPLLLADDGKHICIDTAYYPPSGRWKWASSSAGSLYPALIDVHDEVVPVGGYCWTITDQGAVWSNDIGVLPTSFSISQNYPNPFNPYTEVKFDLPKRAHVEITIYNVLGQEVRTLVDQELAAGSYTADWDGTSSAGKGVSSGVYFYRIKAGEFSETKKMMLLK